MSDAVSVDERIGSFRYFRDSGRWEWSQAVARMHGYAPGQVQPTTALVMSHKHPEDASDVALRIEAMTEQGHPFSSRHRIVDTHGHTHLVLVIGEPLRADDGAVVGGQGFYVDLSGVEDDHTVEAAVADFTAHRALIEQAKGILMVSYNISADRAFDILVWRSQETNTKLRSLAVQIIDDFTTHLQMPTVLRQHADNLLLTAHHRVDSPAPLADCPDEQRQERPVVGPAVTPRRHAVARRHVPHRAVDQAGGEPTPECGHGVQK